jgi:hypothetical protein
MKCRKCGRALRNPESIEAGIGPVCEKAERGYTDPNQTTLFDDPAAATLTAVAPVSLSSTIATMVSLLREAEKASENDAFKRRIRKVLGEQP